MVRLDLTILRYLTNDDFRVLTAIELGMRNHEVVPVNLIESIAKLKRGNTFKVLSNLLKHKLIEHVNMKYEGYSLNYLGYDYLALHSFLKKDILVGVGAKIGVGKESDIYFCYVNPKCVLSTQEDMSDKFCQSNVVSQKFGENEVEGQVIKHDAEDVEEGLVEVDINTNIKEKSPEKEKEKKGKTITNTETNAEVVEIDQEQLRGDIEHNNIEEDREEESKEDIEEIKKNEVNEDDDYEKGLDLSKIDHDIISKSGLKVAILKLARLGRTSFRSIKKKRDYVKNKSQYNWLYLSRISAGNEWKFLCGLHENNFPVPRPIDSNRHAIIMDYIPSFPLCSINIIPNIEKAYNDLVNLVLKLANYGLVHGDFNEFNILVDDKQNMYIIDFPQMISIDHEEAKEYFERDLLCIKNFFWKKFCVNFDGGPLFEKDVKRLCYLDVELSAYGSKKSHVKVKKEKKKKEKVKEKEKEKEDEETGSDEEEAENNDVEGDFETLEISPKKEKPANEKKKEKNSIDDFLDKNMKQEGMHHEVFFDANETNEIKNDEESDEEEPTTSASKIKDNVYKVIKKDFKANHKSNRFKNKKKSKAKNSSLMDF